MESKYYTPTIEEFHVGFEYEMKRSFGDGTVKTKEAFDLAEWEPYTYNLQSYPYVDRSINGVNARNGICGIRVKYLDREDIESCGWEFDDEIENWILSFKKNTYKLTVWFSTQRLRVEIIEIKNELENVIFYGEIKNKSELKKLMNQLNIK